MFQCHIMIFRSELTNDFFDQNRMLESPWSTLSGSVDGFDTDQDFRAWGQPGDGVSGLLCHLFVGHYPVICLKRKKWFKYVANKVLLKDRETEDSQDQCG